jgi:hypothetical protein
MAANFCRMGGSPDDLMIRALQAKAMYEEKRREYQNHHELVQTLKLALENRKMRWEKFRTHVSIRAQQTFTYLLSERQFRGKLNIEHRDRKLDIHVSRFLEGSSYNADFNS